MARLLYNILLEEKPIKWIEKEIIVCKENKNFDLYKISQLIDSNFDKKS